MDPIHSKFTYSLIRLSKLHFLILFFLFKLKMRVPRNSFFLFSYKTPLWSVDRLVCLFIATFSWSSFRRLSVSLLLDPNNCDHTWFSNHRHTLCCYGFVLCTYLRQNCGWNLHYSVEYDQQSWYFMIFKIYKNPILII